MLSTRFTTALAALALFAGIAGAQTTWYVDVVNGNDQNTGLSPTAAFKTISRGNAFSNRGDTIMVAPGIYAPSKGETMPIGPFDGITVVGADPRTTIIDAEVPYPPVSGTYGGDIVQMCSNVHFSGFTIRNGPHGTLHWWSGAIHIDDHLGGGLQVSNTTVENCILDGINRAFYVGNPWDCVIDNITIRNNFVVHCSADAVGFFADPNSTLSIGNVIHNNTIFGGHPNHTIRTALWMEKGVTADIRNNNLIDYTWHAVGIAGGGTNVFEVHHNNCNGGGNSVWIDTNNTTATVNETNTMSTNPMVVDLQGDPHLLYGSPLVDAGDPAMAATTDIDGNGLSGSAIDIGCDERITVFGESDLYLWPSIEAGVNTTFNYLGQPGDLTITYTSVGLSITGPLNLGAMGTLYLDPLGLIPFGGSQTLDASGLAQATVPVPATAMFFGISLYFQSVHFPPTFTSVWLSDLEGFSYGN